QQLTKQVEGHRRQLRLFGFAPEQVKTAEGGGPVTDIVIAAPPANASLPTVPVGAGNGPAPDEAIAFEVESLSVAQGQGPSPGQHLARLADYRELLIEGQAFET